MADPENDRSEICFICLTRPALTWGVPAEGLAANAMVVFFVGMFASASPSGGWSGLLRSPFIFWLAFIPIHLLMRQIVAVDYHGFRMLKLWLETDILAGTVLENLPTNQAKSGRSRGSSV